MKRLMSVLNGDTPNPLLERDRSIKQDQERKAQIEKAAIRKCCEHFEGLGYNVESVEKDNFGWDLEARSGKSTLRIEVKGLSGGIFSVELTPNEYQAFSQQSDAYRLAVILDALEESSLFICRYSREQKAWLVEGSDGKSLESPLEF